MLDCTALTFCIFHFFKTPSTVKHGERCRLSNVPIQDQFSLQHFSPLYFYSLFHTTFSTNLASQDSQQPSSCSLSSLPSPEFFSHQAKIPILSMQNTVFCSLSGYSNHVAGSILFWVGLLVRFWVVAYSFQKTAFS